MFKASKQGILGLLATALLAVPHAQAQAPGAELNSAFPDLASLFNAIDVARAQSYDELAAVTGSDDAREALFQLRQTLAATADMSMDEIMQMPQGAMDMGSSPFGDLEARAADRLEETLRGSHSAAEARDAYANSDVLPDRAAALIRRGEDFHTQLFDIYTDAGITDKRAAVDAAVSDYLSDTRASVPSEPKSATLMFDHPYAGALQIGFPELSGLVWASGWERLASLEALIQRGGDQAARDAVDTTVDRFWSKVDGMPGMLMLPTEQPTAVAISPLLFNRHEQAAIILDNLGMFETVVADLLIHPDVQDRAGAINDLVDEFTDRSSNLATRREYLLAALRPGIFNEGGPALGDLQQSERNRSRMEMEMGPHISMPPGN